MSGRRQPMLLISLIVTMSGCNALSSGAGDRPEGFRLVQGSLQISDDGIIGRQVTGLQLAAVAVRELDGEFVPDIYVSDVFDLNNAQFVVSVDATRAFSLLLQIPGASANGPGSQLGVLRFSAGDGLSDTALIPAGTDDLSLGTLTATDGDPSTAADNLLQASSAQNPLSQVDTDADGQVDLVDADDDDDGVSDVSDSDIAGDGKEDAMQSLQVLADDDANGIADVFE